FNGRDCAIDRTEQVWVITAHHHVIRSDHVSHHRQRVWTERDRVVIKSLQINARQLVDLHATVREVAKSVVHSFHQVRNSATKMADDPPNVRQLFEHSVVTHARNGEARVKRKADDWTKHVFAKRV